MKIAILVNKLTGGGAERVASLWANGFCDRGYEVVVIISDNMSPQTYVLKPEVKTEFVSVNNRISIVRVLNRIIKLRRVLRFEKPDIVIDVIPSWKKIAAMTAHNYIKISTEHNSFERPDNADVQVNCFEKFYLNRLYDHVTVLTQADKDVIGHRLKHVTVLPNPLALKPVTTVPPKKNIVLAVGRLDAWYVKGFDILIKAWAKVSSSRKDWKLQIVGGGKDCNMFFLKTLCEKMLVSDSVMFTGFKADVLPSFQRASIFVMSSRYEGFGLVLIEAMSQGCACIACDYKGRQREIISNENEGLICQPDDVESLAAKLASLIDDEDMRRMLQKNAISRSCDFSIDKIMEKWDNLLNKLNK